MCVLDRRWLVAVVCFVGFGCGPNKPGGGPHSGGLRAQADDAVKQAAVLDYQAPASKVRIERRTKAADLYLASCTKDGDITSCVWAASLSHRVANPSDADVARVQAATDVLVKQCMSNVEDACRAFDGDLGELVTDYSGNTEELCQKGFARACYAFSQWDPAKQRQRSQLDPQMLTLLKKGCELGDPQSCTFAISLVSEQTTPNKDDLAWLTRQLQKSVSDRCGRGFAISCSEATHNQPRTAAAAAVNCARGYLEACSLPAGDTSVWLDKLWPQACAVDGVGCRDLADVTSDGASKRDALEHGCQFGDTFVCSTLVDAYNAKTFAEPVPGRAAAIAKYLCATDPADYCDAAKQ